MFAFDSDLCGIGVIILKYSQDPDDLKYTRA